ncbi:hypothetical protein XBKQ1_490003 [Xenorhabdus bovienii str. kraussei Quebec]|uniref:Uncharacterized protein n=1 Tax=Xenorhabdus bovienii str. kraussei Quebec TaxID=1398203 RepID=A0A077PLE4_XENBV|nr:hypothetical protein XBKQ1_490003 [Xenorhabdus bovienii str. kraussei Quebec]
MHLSGLPNIGELSNVVSVFSKEIGALQHATKKQHETIDRW